MNKLLWLLLTISLFSCSKNEKEDLPEPGVPAVVPPSGVEKKWTKTRTIHYQSQATESMKVWTISELLTSDSSPVNKTETFTFNAKQQLLHYSVEQKYRQSDQVVTMESERYVVYLADNTVEVSDDNGNTLTYTLNSNGYATSCKYQTADQVRFYDFTYSADNYLTGMKESIGNTFFASLDLSYQNGDLISSTTFMNDMENKLLFTAGEKENTEGLPCITVAELYPMSTHTAALYAHLLGKMPQHYLLKSQPENNADEWTDYSYQTGTNGELSSITMAIHYITEE